MKNKIFNILKARYLLNEDASKNWIFILYLLVLAIIMIANTHSYEKKVFLIAELNNQVKELRSEFVDRRSELMKIKMESNVADKMAKLLIVPSSVPPKKIKVAKEKTAWEKLWQ